LALRDFHAENIFWLPERQAPQRVGLIDFQDGLLAPPAYDLVSLLEDARRDVNPDLRSGLIARFCEKAGVENDAAFQNAYSVMGAQRNAKILGIFVRLAKRDNKPDYRRLIPRVKNLFLRDIQGEIFAPLRGWLETHMPDLLKPAITSAMVLAAGHGTRMRPLTDDRSKAMVEVGGQPLIAHMLERLSQAGVTRAVVNVHAHADHLERYLKSRTVFYCLPPLRKLWAIAARVTLSGLRTGRSRAAPAIMRPLSMRACKLQILTRYAVLSP